MRKSKGGSTLKMCWALVVSLIFIWLGSSFPSLAEEERLTRLTIFPDDLALVEELREAKVKKGLTERDVRLWRESLSQILSFPGKLAPPVMDGSP